MMFYILFINSLAPCNPGLTHNRWKLGNASSCEVGGRIKCPIRGIQVDPAIAGAWTRSGCNETFASGLATLCEGGGGG